MKPSAYLLTLSLLLGAQSVFAAVDYKNGFETGAITDEKNVFNPDQWSFVTTPKAAFEMQSATVEIKNGVHPSYDVDKTSLRSTFDVRPDQFGVQAGVPFEGREQFYAFSFRYASTSVYNPTVGYIVMFWEAINPYEQPLQLILKDGSMILRTNDSTGSNDVWTAQVSADAWHRFAMKVKFSEDPAVGSITFYYDNVMVVNDAKYSNIRRPKDGGTPVQNQMVFGFLLNQSKISDDVNAKAVAFYDEIRAGGTLDDVTPVVPVVDAGVPDAGTPPKPDAGVPDSGAGGGAGGGNGGGGSNPPAGGGGGSGGGMAQTGGGPPSGAGGGGETGMPPGPGMTTGVKSSDTSCGCNSSPMATFVLCAGLLAVLRRRRGNERS